MHNSFESKDRNKLRNTKNIPGFTNWLKSLGSDIFQKNVSTKQLREQYEAQLVKPDYIKREKALAEINLEKQSESRQNVSHLIVRKNIPIRDKRGQEIDYYDQIIVQDTKGDITNSNATVVKGEIKGFKFGEFDKSWDEMNYLEKKSQLDHELLHPIAQFCSQQLLQNKSIQNFDKIVEVLNVGLQKVVYPHDLTFITGFGDDVEKIYNSFVSSIFAQYFLKNKEYLASIRSIIDDYTNFEDIDDFAKNSSKPEVVIQYNFKDLHISQHEFIQYITHTYNNFTSIISSQKSYIDGIKAIVERIDNGDLIWEFNNAFPKEIQIAQFLQYSSQEFIEKLSDI